MIKNSDYQQRPSVVPSLVVKIKFAETSKTNSSINNITAKQNQKNINVPVKSETKYSRMTIIRNNWDQRYFG